MKAPILLFLSPRNAPSNRGGREDMLARALRRRAALARRAIGVATLAHWAVVEVHIRHGKNPRSVTRVCRLVVSRLLFARHSVRSEPSSSAHRDGRRPRCAGAGVGACDSSGRVILVAAVEQGGAGSWDVGVNWSSRDAPWYSTTPRPMAQHARTQMPSPPKKPTGNLWRCSHGALLPSLPPTAPPRA